MRTALITGTSSGMGLETAVELAKRNWSVVATMRDLEKRSDLDHELAAAGVNDRVRVGRLDVTDAGSIDKAVAGLDLANRPLDAVVHNAGIGVGGAFEDIDEATIRRVMEVNFFGILALTRALLPAFRSQRHGRILIVSSDSAFAGEPTASAYCASKWAIEGWAEAIAYELEPFNIQITLIEPGPYRTNIWKSAPRVVPDTSAYRPLLLHLNEVVDEHVEKTARDPQEVAKAIATALEAKNPRFRYAVGPIAKVSHFMRGKVPARVWRGIVSR